MNYDEESIQMFKECAKDCLKLCKEIKETSDKKIEVYLDFIKTQDKMIANLLGQINNLETQNMMLRAYRGI